MVFRYSSIILLAFLFYQCTSTQDSTSNSSASDYNIDKPNFKDGNCYAKCLMPNKYEVYSDHYPIYTGDITLENVQTETKTIELQQAGTKWVKKKADKKCISADPNDCLVWCLVEVPAITETITILSDTTQSKNYEIKTFSKEELIQKGGFTEWRQVICENKIQPTLINQIQSFLKEEEYYSKSNTSKLDRDTKAALTNFQKDHRLPVGNLDLETLDFMGIEVYL